MGAHRLGLMSRMSSSRIAMKDAAGQRCTIEPERAGLPFTGAIRLGGVRITPLASASSRRVPYRHGRRPTPQAALRTPPRSASADAPHLPAAGSRRVGRIAHVGGDPRTPSRRRRPGRSPPRRPVAVRIPTSVRTSRAAGVLAGDPGVGSGMPGRRPRLEEPGPNPGAETSAATAQIRARPPGRGRAGVLGGPERSGLLRQHRRTGSRGRSRTDRDVDRVRGRGPGAAGLNYLELATLAKKDAIAKVVDFLCKSGVEAFAAPVDRAGRTPTIPSTAIALPGVTE